MAGLNWWEQEGNILGGRRLASGTDWAEMGPSGDLSGGGQWTPPSFLAPKAAPTPRVQAPQSAAAPKLTDWTKLYSTDIAPMASPSRTSGATVSGGGTITSWSPQIQAQLAAGPEPALTPGDAMWRRLQAILQNPSGIEGDPEYQFIVDQGTKALSRSAGARRMRFAGKTMQDFQDFGQRAANQYTGAVVNRLQAAASEERTRPSEESLGARESYLRRLSELQQGVMQPGYQAAQPLIEYFRGGGAVDPFRMPKKRVFDTRRQGGFGNVDYTPEEISYARRLAGAYG